MTAKSINLDDQGRLLLLREQVRKELNLPDRMVTQFLEAHGIGPLKMDGSAHEGRGREWYRLQELLDAINREDDDSRSYPTQTERLAAYRGDMVKMDLMIRQKDLLPAARLLEVFSESFKVIVAALESIYDVFERDASADEATCARIEKLIVEARNIVYMSLVELCEQHKLTSPSDRPN